MTTPLLVTTDEAAKMLAVTPSMVRKLQRGGRLEPVKIGRLTRFRVSDVATLAVSPLLSTAGASGVREPTDCRYFKHDAQAVRIVDNGIVGVATGERL